MPASHSAVATPLHRTKAEVARAEIRRQIVLGELPPGAPLVLDELAASLGMSMSPVRESLRQLETLGLVEYVAHYGARVSEMSLKNLEEAYDLRGAVESLVVRRAAARFTPDDAAAVRQVMRHYESVFASGDVLQILATNKRLYFRIYEVADSAWLLRQLEPAWESCERYRAAVVRGGEGDKAFRAQRRGLNALLRALSRREPDEAEACQRELIRVLKELFLRTLSRTLPESDSGSA